MNVSIVLAFFLRVVTGLAAVALLAGGQGPGEHRRPQGNRQRRHTN